jgi:dihydrofolate reductase/thymidylate synthase
MIYFIKDQISELIKYFLTLKHFSHMQTSQSLNIKPFSCIVAYCRQNMGIGKDGNLPWPMLRADLKNFAKITSSTESLTENSFDIAQKSILFNSVLTQHLVAKNAETQAKSQKINAVVMGRKTWESIPQSKRPLQNRLNVVLTSKPDEFRKQLEEAGTPQENVMVCSSFETAMVDLSADAGVGEIFVIGGSSLYEKSINGEYKDYCKLIIATRINKLFECDTFIPEVENVSKDSVFAPLHVSETYSQGDITFDYCFFGNCNILSTRPELVPNKLMNKYEKHPEMQYLEAIDDIIKTGKYKDDRTGTGIYSKFGKQMRYDLSKSFPVLTTKNVFWRGVAEELLWFAKGDTNAKKLSDKKIKIWDGNASR